MTSRSEIAARLDQAKRDARWAEQLEVHMDEGGITCPNNVRDLIEMVKRGATLIAELEAKVADLEQCQLCNAIGTETPCAYPTETARHWQKRAEAAEAKVAGLRCRKEGWRVVKAELSWPVDEKRTKR